MEAIYLQIFVLKEVDIIVPLESAESNELNGVFFDVCVHSKF